MPDDGLTCKCVKWHAPRPTRLGALEVGDGRTIHLCPASYTAVTDCLTEIRAAGGRPKRADMTKFPKFARDLAVAVWAMQVGKPSAMPPFKGDRDMSPPAAEVESTPEPEADGSDVEDDEVPAPTDAP